jgi:diaminopimelate epimerase
MPLRRSANCGKGNQKSAWWRDASRISRGWATAYDRGVSFAFVKGHGTRNDFVVLPDLDGTVHGDLEPEVVAALCDRRAGLGSDGVLRVLRGDVDGGADWFMDYRNADGSVSQMCGNGIRVFARYLVDAGLVDPGSLDGPLPVDTRDGIKLVTFCDDGEISVDMGNPKVGGEVTVSVDGVALTARRVDTGNPHAVVFVADLADAGELARSPYFCGVEYPEGVNIEFVVRRGPGQVAMRVFERGVGETWSCGTGACAAVAAAVVVDAETSGDGSGSPDLPSSYAVEVPGGRLAVTWDTDDHLHLKGPAVLVASGTWST